VSHERAESGDALCSLSEQEGPQEAYERTSVIPLVVQSPLWNTMILVVSSDVVHGLRDWFVTCAVPLAKL